MCLMLGRRGAWQYHDDQYDLLSHHNDHDYDYDGNDNDKPPADIPDGSSEELGHHGHTKTTATHYYHLGDDK